MNRFHYRTAVCISNDIVELFIAVVLAFPGLCDGDEDGAVDPGDRARRDTTNQLCSRYSLFNRNFSFNEQLLL